MLAGASSQNLEGSGLPLMADVRGREKRKKKKKGEREFRGDGGRDKESIEANSSFGPWPFLLWKGIEGDQEGRRKYIYIFGLQPFWALDLTVILLIIHQFHESSTNQELLILLEVFGR